MEQTLDKILGFLTETGGKIIVAVIVLIIGHFVIKGIMRLLRKGKGFQKIEKTVRSFLESFIKIGLECILIVSAIAILGIPMASVVAVFASAGLTIGLALQGSLSNFAGGLMIILFKPFAVGDFIEAKDCKGYVKSISLFYTVMLTLDNKKVTIPNSSITSANVTNYTAEDKRRVDIKFNVSYDSNIEKVKSVIHNVIYSHPLAIMEPEPLIKLSNHLDSSLEITTLTWCKTEDYWTVFYDITEQVDKAFRDNNIEIPFNQMDIHVKQ